MNTVDPITATYAHDDADWTITVSGLGKELTDSAPGIIAARDRADQLVEKVAPERGGRTVVHLLNGSAFDFTAAYIEARLTTSSGSGGAKGSAGAAGSTASAGGSASGKASKGKAAKPATTPAATKGTAPKSAPTKSEPTPADSEQKEPAVATAASAS
ncbi:MAG: hypothetical protein GEU97_19065 [Actinophytocola sp.]|nr:hypothetical protein [Actinophytocola sp.]